MNDKEFASCVLWSLGSVNTEYHRVTEVAEAYKILRKIEDGKSVVIDVDELAEPRDLKDSINEK